MLIVSATPFSFIATGFAIVALILGVIAVVSLRLDKKRANALRIFAKTNGLIFKEKIDSPADIGLPNAVVFQQGRGRKLTSAMVGEIAGSQVCVLDHRYSIGSGSSGGTIQQMVVAIEIRGKRLPDFTLALEDHLQVTGKAIHIEESLSAEFPDFSERYRLYGNDEFATRALFTPRMTELCVANRIYCIESCQGWLIVIEEDLRPTGDKLQKRIESAFGYLTELDFE